MKRFAALFDELDTSTATNAKVAALRRYLAEVDDADAAWAVYLLAGGKPRQLIKTSQLRAQAIAEAGLPEWLFEASYQAVGDLAETIALVLPTPTQDSGMHTRLSEWMEQRLLPLRGQPDEAVAEALRGWWRELDASGRFLLVKLVGGGFRVGVSKLLVQRALAAHAGLDAKQVAARMMGFTDSKRPPSVPAYRALIAPADEAGERDPSLPYPFFLASPLGEQAGDNDLMDMELASNGLAQTMQDRLGPASDWRAEWKFDGIRGQIVKRAGQVWVWSRGEELMSERFPELQALAQRWPDGTVVDGEILVWHEGPGSEPAPALPGSERPGAPAPFALLQQRIARKTLGAKVLADAPVSFMAYDLLEADGQDLRGRPQQQRRERLEALADTLASTPGPRLWLSPVLMADDWPTLATWRVQARTLGVEGLMLKHRDSAYGSGRQRRGDGALPLAWWKWKTDALSIDGVLIYAQAGHGRRASVYTDYTFAVWNRAPRDAAEAQAVVEAIAQRRPADPDGLQLVAFTKAYSGLSDAEFKSVDAVIRRHTLEKFGPVRSVRPTLVFELAFEGIARSTRHKSGVALRFPRMQRIRHDKPLHEANTLQDLELLLDRGGA